MNETISRGVDEPLPPSPSHRPSPRVSRGRCDGEGGRGGPLLSSPSGGLPDQACAAISSFHPLIVPKNQKRKKVAIPIFWLLALRSGLSALPVDSIHESVQAHRVPGRKRFYQPREINRLTRDGYSVMKQFLACAPAVVLSPAGNIVLFLGNVSSRMTTGTKRPANAFETRPVPSREEKSNAEKIVGDRFHRRATARRVRHRR